MDLVKAIHVLAVFIWVGNLLALTRLMGYHVKQDAETQLKLAKIYRRMVYFIGIPTMVLAILCGMLLIQNVNWDYRPGWFHMKLLFIVGLVIADMIVMRQVAQLNEAAEEGRGVRFKILHGVVGLLLIGVLCSVYVVRDRKGEMRLALKAEWNAWALSDESVVR